MPIGLNKKKALPFVKTAKDDPIRAKDEVWVTRSGVKVLVGDMEEHHVRNALRLVIRVFRKAGYSIDCLHDRSNQDPIRFQTH